MEWQLQGNSVTFPWNYFDTLQILVSANSMGASSSIINSTDHVIFSSIRLIPFQRFKTLGTFPRYPDHQDITVTLTEFTETQYQDALIVYISHVWLRSTSNREGWDGRPHPDDALGRKYRLCCEGIEEVKNRWAAGVNSCYVWVDYGCIDQDKLTGFEASNQQEIGKEWKKLDKIMQLCDCIFTPLVEEEKAEEGGKIDAESNNTNINAITSSRRAITSVVDAIESKAWSGEIETAYLKRSWCRLEMLYGAFIPSFDEEQSGGRSEKFSALFQSFRKENQRPHIVYTQQQTLTVLPPLHNLFFQDYHPLHGLLTNPALDTEAMNGLMDGLRLHMRPKKERYEGHYSSEGLREGVGRYYCANGDVYEGDWLRGKKEGRGKYLYASGNVYEGDWKQDQKSGQGIFHYQKGDVYEGDWLEDQRNGQGKYIYVNGDHYEGAYERDQKKGKGKYVYLSTGNVYEGDWLADKRHGVGVFLYRNGAQYTGTYALGKKHGQGIFLYPNGDRYEGEYREDLRHGHGIYYDHMNGGQAVYDGEWIDDEAIGEETVGEETAGEEIAGEENTTEAGAQEVLSS